MNLRTFVTHINEMGVLVDNRQQSKVKHPIALVLCLYLLAKMAGYDNSYGAEDFCRHNQDVLSEKLGMLSAPSHDTFSRVLRMVDDSAFAKVASLLQKATQKRSGRSFVKSLIAIDGKTMRGTGHKGGPNNSRSQAHIVSAFDHANKSFMGQVLTSEKSNEITAIPRLLRNLGELHGAVVTIDAMGTQRKIAQQILSQGGDYCLALKGNQSSLADDAELFFQSEDASDVYTTSDYPNKDHWKRTYKVYYDAEWMDRGRKENERFGIKCLATVDTHVNGVFKERRSFVISKNMSAKEVAEVVRGHWSIESLHWSLDMTFDEDWCSIKNHRAAANESTLNKLALLLLKEVPTEVLAFKSNDTNPSVDRRRNAFRATLRNSLDWMLSDE